MDELKQHLGRVVRCFVLSAGACLASGVALATCTPTLPITAGSVPCYITVQPVDVGTTVNGSVIYAPFNTTSQIGNPSTAGMPFSAINLLGLSLPNNPTSANPIGFVVNPTTGLFPGQSGYQGPGVDVTRALLNNIGVDLVWLPMATYVTPNAQTSQNFTTLNVTATSTGTAGTLCNGFVSGTTLTVTSCGASGLAVYTVLSGSTIITSPAPGTFISALGTGSGGAGTYTINISQTVGSSKRPVQFTATPGTLAGQDFLTLAQQDTKVTTPCAISKQPCTPLSPRGGAQVFTTPDPTVINLFFVNKLNPPASGGTLYGLSLICNNGVAIGGNTFFAPTPLQARPDTIAHEMLHDLCLSHLTYGAGAYNPLTASNPFPPGGIAPPVNTANPFTGECDPNYPGCGTNLMTSGDLRTEPTLVCVLNGYGGVTTPGCSGLPSLATGTADQVTIPAQESTSLPMSQQREVLAGMSGLLFPPTILGGLITPIPYETTKAQLETGGSSSGRVIFDLSGPVDGKPGETLVAWVLSFPQEQTFAARGGFDIISQSRKDLVQDVNYYPNPVNNPLTRKVAYDPGIDNNPDNPEIGTAGPSPCAATTAACLIVKFQTPGLGADDSINFSQSILSGGAPISKDDLCKAKITYMFSDGYMTTSNFGRCPPVSLALIASSWHPDPQVAPQVLKTNVLLAQAPPLPCTPVDGACLDPTTTPPEDADPTKEGGQLGQSCDNGATVGSISVSGTIKGPNVTVNAGQRCNFTNCEFLGSLTINGGNVFLGNCQVDGNLTMTSGTLNLAASTRVIGNVQIANGSADSTLPNNFTIGPSAQINGGLTIQNLPANEPGLVCGTTVSGGITVNNNQSSIEIGEPAGQQNCPGNKVAGGLNCKGNTNITGGGNTVRGSVSPQCPASLVQ